MQRVLFACVHNAGRSQMAAAWLTALAHPSKVEAISAGTEPGGTVYPEVIAVMREVGVDFSGAFPRLLTAEIATYATLLVTMGCGEACPHIPGLPRVDWPLADPKGRSLTDVRAIRDEIRERIDILIREHGWERPGTELTSD